MGMEMTDGTWRHDLMRVMKLDEEEIALWGRIAEMFPSHNCRQLIHMMIRREKEEMESLRMLLGEAKPGFGPCPDDPMPYSEKEKKK